MTRSKQVEGPPGTLDADGLQRWLGASQAGLGAAGITATFGRAPTIGGAPGPTWVSMTASGAHGRLIRAADGATTVTAHALPASGRLLDERHPHTTVAQLDALVAALGGPRLPTAGRA